MVSQSLYFTGPGELEIRPDEIPRVTPETVRVETTVSAISAGTERLIYRGDAPETLNADGPVKTLEEDLSFPVQYGYSAVGHVTDVGELADEEWLGRRVFAYNPHETHFLARPEELIEVPDRIPTRQAALLANAETAVNFLLDGQPAIGERVAVFGQGVVGLLTTGLLAWMPLDSLITVEPLSLRQELSREFGTSHVLDPDAEPVDTAFESLALEKADLTFELSGNPEALNDAVSITGFDGRIVVGSWYGTNTTPLDLGGRFHRNRLDIESSQVSTIAPRHEGRWDRKRRHDIAWECLDELPVDSLITHEIPFEKAEKAYTLLEVQPGQAVQILLTYD